MHRLTSPHSLCSCLRRLPPPSSAPSLPASRTEAMHVTRRRSSRIRQVPRGPSPARPERRSKPRCRQRRHGPVRRPPLALPARIRVERPSRRLGRSRATRLGYSAPPMVEFHILAGDSEDIDACAGRLGCDSDIDVPACFDSDATRIRCSCRFRLECAPVPAVT